MGHARIRAAQRRADVSSLTRGDKGGGLTKGFLPGDDGLVKSAELNKGIPYPDKRMHQVWVDRAHAHGALKVSESSPRLLAARGCA